MQVLSVSGCFCLVCCLQVDDSADMSIIINNHVMNIIFYAIFVSRIYCEIIYPSLSEMGVMPEIAKAVEEMDWT